MHHNEILAYWKKNGKTLEDIKGLYTLTDNLKDPIFISQWAVSGLAEPTQTDLDSITQSEKDTAETEQYADRVKATKIKLQGDITDGTTLGYDMSKQQTELNAL